MIHSNPPTPYQSRMAVLALMSSVVLATLDITVSNTALPRISLDLGTSEASVIWVANAYQIAMVAVLLPLASLGESIGYKRVYVGGVILFNLASLLCGLSDSLSMLVTGRIAQGLGAAAIMSVNTALIRHIYPLNRLGKGISMNALVVAVAFTLGPLVASTLLSFTTWHWLFLINLPVGAVAFVLSMRFLPDVKGQGLRFDSVSALLCSGFLGLLTYSLCAIENRGSAILSGVAIAGCALCLLTLLRLQRTHPAPILAIDLLRIPIIGLSSLTSICAFATQALAFVALPFFLQNALGKSLVSTGFLLTAWSISVAVMAAVTSRIGDRFEPGILCSIGLAILSAGMVSLALLTPDSSQASVVFRLVVCGGGFGLYQAPNMRTIMGNAPTHRSGGASGVIAVSRLLGQTFGAGMVALCFHAWSAQGPAVALGLGCVTAAVGCVFSALRLRTRAPRATA